MKFWVVPLIVFLIFLTLIALVSILFLNPLQNKWDNAKAKCDEMQGCKRFGCYAELQNYAQTAKTNFLLREQNCLKYRNDENEVKG